MKKISFLVSFLLISLVSFAQEPAGNNVIRISPLGLATKVRLHYEHALGNSGSVGAIGSFHYGVLFTGVKAEPFARLYVSGTAPEGFYFQGKVNGGLFTSNLPYVYIREVYDQNGNLIYTGNDDGSDVKVNFDRSFTTFGGGAGFGYQALLGNKKNIALDLFLGANYNTYPFNKQFKIREESTDANGNKVITTYTPDIGSYVWHITGPGSYFNSMVSIGYVF